MQTLYLLDAYALIYRAYYALIRSPRINSKGQNTSAIFGFVNTLNDVLRSHHPDFMGIAFDPAGGTFRHEAYPEYKAQREATPEDIRLSVPIIKDIIRAFRIPILEVAGYEADDVIGTLARKGAEQGLEVRMVTPDKDYAQLVTPNIKMVRPGSGSKPAEVMGEKEVYEKYGVTSTAQIIDLLGLMGDTADNIPGCPGGGETHRRVWRHRRTAQPHGGAERGNAQESGGECGANPFFQIPCHHQNGRAHRAGQGKTQFEGTGPRSTA